jgi:hypothetical protein
LFLLFAFCFFPFQIAYLDTDLKKNLQYSKSHKFGIKNYSNLKEKAAEEEVKLRKIFSVMHAKDDRFPNLA